MGFASRSEIAAFLKELANMFGIYLYAFIGSEKSAALETRKRQLERDYRQATCDPILIGRSAGMGNLDAQIY